MKKEILRELASRNTQKETIKSKLEMEIETMENNTEKKITKVLQISGQFVKDFCKTASKEDCEWVLSTMARHREEKDNVKYFAPFRTEFARKFFPEMVSKKTKAKKVELIDEIYQIAQGKGIA